MAVGHQDHGGITVPPAVLTGGLDQGIDLGRREVLAGAQLGVRESARRNCPIFGAWNYKFQR
jgi:hypothetical protein